mgnify:FL=1
MAKKKLEILHQLYEQLIFICTCYADSIEIDVTLLDNAYAIALLEAILYEGEITEAALGEYNNLMQYRGCLSEVDGNNGQANVDKIMEKILELQK